MMFGNGAVRFLHALTSKFKDDEKKIYFMAPEFALNARGTYKKAYAGKIQKNKKERKKKGKTQVCYTSYLFTHTLFVSRLCFHTIQ